MATLDRKHKSLVTMDKALDIAYKMHLKNDYKKSTVLNELFKTWVLGKIGRDELKRIYEDVRKDHMRMKLKHYKETIE